MANVVKTDADKNAANEQPKEMTKAEMFQKMLADQKLIREELRKGTSFKVLREKYGFVFKTS